MAYGRGSAIPGSNVTLLGMSAGAGKGARAGWAGQRGAGVGLTVLGGSRHLGTDCRSRQEVPDPAVGCSQMDCGSKGGVVVVPEWESRRKS